MSTLALTFHGKFHCAAVMVMFVFGTQKVGSESDPIKAINVRKKNIVQMRPLNAEIKNNN